MKEKIKALIFDIGGVLFLPKRKSQKHVLNAFLPTCILIKKSRISGRKFYENTIDVYQKSSKGEIPYNETLVFFSKELGISREKTRIIFNRIYKKNVVENKKLYDYSLKLRKQGYKIGILSTQFHLSTKILVPDKYYKEFNGLDISCDSGLKKPDLRSYMSIIKKLKIKSQESIFIDDKKENLNAAKKLGMKTILFKNNRQFFSDLKKFNL